MNIMSQTTAPTYSIEIKSSFVLQDEDGEPYRVEVGSWLSGTNLDEMLNNFKQANPNIQDFSWKQLTPKGGLIT